MNESRNGVIKPLDIANKPHNVTLIDEAERKKESKNMLQPKNNKNITSIKENYSKELA